MAWRQPKRNGRKTCCNQRGQCSCQRRSNELLSRRPDALSTCTHTCGWNGQSKTCGRQTRNGVCPCPNC